MNSMEKNELYAQYDRLIKHLQSESSEWLWYHNFFLATNIAILSTLTKEGSKQGFVLTVCVFSILLSLIWIFVSLKQKSWLSHWIEKIKSVEKYLGIPEDIVLYDHTNVKSRMLTVKKGGLTKWLMITPFLIIILDIVIILFPSLRF